MSNQEKNDNKLYDAELNRRLKKMHNDLYEPGIQFERENVRNTIVFLGSAQTLPFGEAEKQMQVAELQYKQARRHTKKQMEALNKAKNTFMMSRFYLEAEALAYKLALWAKDERDPKRKHVLCSGGGPGIMKAMNQGASRANERSIGLCMNLPFEKMPNEYVSKELEFQFNYLFLRKFWFFHFMRALVIFPGGFGTLDEVFEILALIQTGQLKKMPIALYGTDYWKEVINFEPMLEYSMINAKHLKMLHYFDDVKETLDFITRELSKAHPR